MKLGVSIRINNELLYFTSAFVAAGRFSNSAINTNALALVIIIDRHLIMDKARRKELLQQLAEKNLLAFRKSLPVDEHIFPKLFEFIDEKLSVQGCQNNFAIANMFCDEHHIDKQVLFKWINEQGQGCDCEILNLEDIFQYLNPPTFKPVSKTPAKKQKLNSLKTDYGFCINNIPSPWVLTETIFDDKSVYNFQIGKGSDCIVSVETSFPTGQFNNDEYWLNCWIKETALNYNLENLIVERPEIDNYFCIAVKSKDWIPVLYWFKSNLTDKWFLRMKTGSTRHKGDFNAFIKLLNFIQVDG